MRSLWETLICYGKNFYKRFKAAEKEHVPTKQVKNWKMLKWFGKHISEETQEEILLWKQYLETTGTAVYQDYFRVRNQVRSSTRKLVID